MDRPHDTYGHRQLMTRYLTFIALMATVGVCQALEMLGQTTDGYVKAHIKPPPRTVYEVYLDVKRNPYGALGTFDFSHSDEQSKTCYRVLGRRTAGPDDVRQVTMASEQGHALCQHLLGTLYEAGNGVSQDLYRARMLYLQAAPNDPTAYVELGRMARDGVGEPVDFVRARALFRQAGPGGVVGLGGLMEQGKGGPQDVQGALNLYMQTTRNFRDPAWGAMRALLDNGMSLDTAQVEKYNQLWISGFQSLQQMKIKRDASLKKFRYTEWMRLTVSYRFPVEQGRPAVSLVESSGDSQLDETVLRVLDKLPMDDPYMAPAGMRTPDMVAPIILGPGFFGS